MNTDFTASLKIGDKEYKAEWKNIRTSFLGVKNSEIKVPSLLTVRIGDKEHEQRLTQFQTKRFIRNLVYRVWVVRRARALLNAV